jgi:hypothetical protein
MTMVNGAPTSSLESRLRRTEQLLDHQQKKGYGQDSSSDEDSPCTTDDKEFQDLIAFLSANDDNILKYLLES